MSLRARVTLAFTAVLAVVLAGSGTFIAVRSAHELQRTQDRGLRERAAQLGAAVARDGVGRRLAHATGIEADEDVTQVVGAEGSVRAASARATRPLLTRAQLRAALRAPHFLDRPGDARLDEDLRLLATPASAGVLVIGASHDEVAEAQRSLIAVEAVALSTALLAGAVGAWMLAGTVVRPVRAALAREQRFVADASHELRTPLAVLKSELEVTRMEGGDAAALRTGLASAEDEVDRLSRLADDLLVLARADAGGLALHCADVAVDAVLARAARGHPGTLVHPSGLRVGADALQLERAVRNLVDNAAQHGAVPVEVGAERRDGAVVLSVRDHGPGIPTELADRALAPFARGDRGGLGAGLGLAIVDAVARAHGGDVRVLDAAPGTRVELALPVRS